MPYKELYAHQIDAFLQQPDAVLVDTRDIHSFNAGHIKGAQQIDGPSMGKLIRQRHKKPPVLVYCYHGVMSRDIAEMISGFGFDNVSHLIGGWEAWANYQIAPDKDCGFVNDELLPVHT